MLTKTFLKPSLATKCRFLIGPVNRMAFGTESKQKIDFGFEQVDYEKKQEKVAEVFTSVAESYDLMNDAMSMGIHRVWKNEFVKMIGPLKPRRILDDEGIVIRQEPLRVLDVAGGTGDISFRILDKAWEDSPNRKSSFPFGLTLECRTFNQDHGLRHQPRYARGRQEESG